MAIRFHRIHVVACILALTLAFLFLLLVGMGSSPMAQGKTLGASSPNQPAGYTTSNGTLVVSTDPWIEYAPGRIIFKVRPGVPLGSDQAHLGRQAPTLARLLNDLGATGVDPVFADSLQRAARGRSSATGLERIYRVSYSSTVPMDHALALLRADPNVEYAEPDYVARSARVPNDPEYGQQWFLTKVNAPVAWDVSVGASDVVIALIDSGVDTDHPDLASRLWTNADEVAGNNQDDDLNGFKDDLNGWNVIDNSAVLEDDNGHGTQTAGVAGAATDNGVGVAGMCWNCKLMIVKAMQPTGIANYSDIAEGIAYAASNGAQIINLSLGGYADSTMLRDAVREAATTAVLVGGAGNDDSPNPFYPAAYPEVIAVAATDQNDQQSVFSNYGAWVDVAAPGELIRTTQVGGYATGDGTSFSSPLVAGLAGLIRSAHPDWSPALVRWQILNTATDIDALNPTRAGQLGQGRVDAGAALSTAPQPQAAVVGYAIDGESDVRPEPGQSFQLAVTLYNQWMPAQNLSVTLSSGDPYVTVSDASGFFGSIDTGKTGANGDDPFALSVSSGAPYNHPLALTLDLSGDNSYSLSLPFTLPVRSGVETLGNTMYLEDTVWTADKTYVLNGTVIVGTGVTLTVQPGTVIKGNPGKFIRVDGTLIARGTADQPILFTTNSISNATWSGIRFTENAVDASYNVSETYVAGSVLQYVEVAYADIAASLSTRSPYIADSTFRNNGTSIQIGNNNNGGSSHIERNTFSGGGSGGNAMPGYGSGAISLSGGQSLIKQNSFTGVSGGVTGSGSPTITDNTFRNNSGSVISISGSPNIVGNVIQNNSGTAIAISGGAPLIHDNMIVGNGGGIDASGLQVVDIEHNLIANNGGTSCPTPPCGVGGAALSLDVQSSGFSQSSPALAYNAQRDEYLAVWVESTGTGAVKALRLTGDGQPIGGEIDVSGQIMITGIGGAYVTYHPVQDRYFVVWYGMTGIQGRFFAASGQPIGNAFAISTSYTALAKVGYQPSDDTFVVAYQAQETNGPEQLVYVQRLTTGGALSGNSIVVGNDLGGTNVYLGDIAVDPASNKALVVLNADSGQNRIWGAWIETATQTVSSTVIAENPEWYPLKNPAAAYGAGANRYEVVWERYRGWDNWSDPRSLMVQPINANGSLPISSTEVFSDAGQASTPQITFGSTPGEFMVVWVQGPTSSTPASHKLYGRRLDSNGTGIGSPILVSAPISASSMYGIQMGSPAIAYNSQRNEYLVVWSDNRTGSNSSIWAQRLNAAGQLLDNAWTQGDETNPVNNFRISQPRGVRYNTIIGNTGYGIQLGGQAAASVNIVHNNLFGNGTYDLYLSGGQAGTQNFTLDATNNYWNLPTGQIVARIRDCTFDDNACDTPSSTLSKVAYTPVLTDPDPDAPAYVRSAVLSPDPVGTERGVLTVDFSRPMLTDTLPTASFHDARRGTVEKMLDYPVQAMGQDVIGRLWFAGDWSNPGVKMFDGQKWNSAPGITGTITAIYGASNGDVWFAHAETAEFDQPALSRLQGATLITYTRSQITSTGWIANITAINEDSTGNLWFGSDNGAWRYDGVQWEQLTAGGSDSVYQIVRDGQGRMWLRTANGLKVFDGVNWQTYNKANGLPTNQVNTLFADSQGRVWVGLGWYESNGNDRDYVGMYDGAGWSFYGSNASSGLLNCDVNGFAEAPDGSIWMRSCMQMVIFDGQSWSLLNDGASYDGATLFDSRGNLWFTNYNGLHVRWGGLDYAFSDGQWLSPTRLQAGYDFGFQVPPGDYTVQVDGGVGGDDMPAYGGSDATFKVDFGGAVSILRPYPPQVQAETDGDLSNISATWSTPDEDVDRFRYAIGSFPGGRDLVGWTYTADTRMARADLRLQQGQAYYVVVQAHRRSNDLWSEDGLSNPITGGVVTNPTATPTPTHTPMLTGTPTPTPTVTPTPTPTVTPTPVSSSGSVVYLPALQRNPTARQQIGPIQDPWQIYIPFTQR